jgi:hypothetical protein
VTGQTESGSLGSLHFARKAQQAAKDRQAKHGNEGEDFPTATCREARASRQYPDHRSTKQNETDNQNCRGRH